MCNALIHVNIMCTAAQYTNTPVTCSSTDPTHRVCVRREAACDPTAAAPDPRCCPVSPTHLRGRHGPALPGGLAILRGPPSMRFPCPGAPRLLQRGVAIGRRVQKPRGPQAPQIRGTTRVRGALLRGGEHALQSPAPASVSANPLTKLGGRGQCKDAGNLGGWGPPPVPPAGIRQLHAVPDVSSSV